MRRIGMAAGALAALAAGGAWAQDGAPHLCAAWVDAESGETRIIDLEITAEEPLRGVIDMGEGPLGFIGRRHEERCAILTGSGLALSGVCTPGAFEGSFTIREGGGDDDDDDGPPPTPVTFTPADCP